MSKFGSELEYAFSHFAFAIACLIVFATAATADPVIFNWSNIANSRDVVNLQGHDFGKNPTVWCSTNGGAAVQIPILNGGNGIVHVRMPSPLGLYGVHVMNGSSASSIVYINRANPMHLDTPEVVAGRSFRIFGRNLYMPGFKPQVIFVSGANNYQADVNANPAYNQLSVRAPANIPLGVYSIYVSNGMGSWSLAKASCQEELTIRSAGPDTFNLNVPWAADLTFGSNIYNVRNDPRLSLHAVGDGNNNDQVAIQKAIDTAAAAHGGVVYLPAGTYRLQSLSGPLMNFGNNVVVQGAGQDETKINYGFGNPGENFSLAMFSQVSNCGLIDLAIENLNQNNTWLNTGTITNCGTKVNRLFLARVKANFQNGNRVELKGDRIVIEQCDLSSIYTLLFLGTSTNSRVFDNRLTQMLGVHLDLTLSENCVVENNTFSLDANQGRTVPGNVRHGMAIGFAHNLAIINNNWSVFNGAPSSNNDGESILSEGGGGMRTGEETGAVMSTSATTINVSQSAPYHESTVIAIINGAGTGQWRSITARTGNAITVGIPWTVVPDKSSMYSVFIWSNQNTTISGNTFTNWLRGIWIYQGSTTDTQISNNHLNTMDGIFIEPCQNTTAGNGQFNPVWNTVIDHNVLSSSASTPTYINFTGDLQQTTSLIGTLALNNQVYENTVSGTGATIFENDPACTEGYCNYLRVEASPYVEQAVPAILGTVFQKNIANHCGVQSYLLNGGDYQTTIADMPGSGESNGKSALVHDTTRYWNTPGTHSSVGTVILSAGSNVAPEQDKLPSN